MTKRLFGTDGIRGRANEHPMTAEMALKVGRAAGLLLLKENRMHTILIGKDTRISGYMLENALTAGLCSVGIRVLLTGPLPTPGVSYIMRSLRCDGAIMISASHNAYEDNGIKLFGPDGYKLADAMEDEIDRLIATGEVDEFRPTGAQIGTARRIDDAVGRYIEFAKATFPKGMRLDGLRIVADCAHGAAYKALPNTLSELGADVIELFVRPNGVNINDKCGAVNPEEMRAMVIREKADLGIAFDGDGDRIAMADADGRLLDGNALLAIIGIDKLERGELPKNTLVTNIVANGGLERALEPFGGKTLRCKVGDRHVVEAMRENGLTVGGESSGHIVLLDHNTTGDAMIAALQVLAILVRRNQPLAELARPYQPFPEYQCSVPFTDRPKPPQEQLDAVVASLHAEIDESTQVVVRPSGTEPIVRVTVQHQQSRQAEQIARAIAERVAAL